MQTTTVGVDLAKNCFQVVEADAQYRLIERRRLTRLQFSRWMGTRPPCQVVMEACGSSHHWARVLKGYGHNVKLLPAQHVRAYVRRSKTDAADAAALIEDSRSGEIRSVEVKSVGQQVLQQLHRARSRWQAARVARINALRGMLRESGIDVPEGAVRGIATIGEALEVGDNGLPDLLRPVIEQLLKEIEEFADTRAIEHRVGIRHGTCRLRVFRRIVGSNPGIRRRWFSAADTNTGIKKNASITARDLTTVQYRSRRGRA